MKELVGTLGAWRAEGAQVARAIVVRTFWSSPRPEGAALIATADGRLAGSVSGGCVEGAACDEIERARATGHARVVRYGISDEQAWSVGLACGGTIDVLVEPFVRPEAEAAAQATAASSGDVSGQPGHGRAVITPLPADSPGPEFGAHATGDGAPPEPVLVAWADGRLEGSLGDASADAELGRLAVEALRRGMSRTVELAGRSLFIETYPERQRLVIVGAVQVAIPLVAIARTLGYETVVVDGRPAFATRERFPDVDRLVVGWPDEVADDVGLGPADAVAVLSHDVKFDEPAIVTALARGCRYVGAVGSKKTQADRRARLLEAGVAPTELSRLRGPIGLDLGGRQPAETALAIMAEVVAERYAGTGRPMRDTAADASRAGHGSGSGAGSVREGTNPAVVIPTPSPR
jgi:xanthine dehydrogenase accessory factor